MLEVQSPVELFLADRETMNVLAGRQLGLERQPETGESCLRVRRRLVYLVVRHSCLSRQNRAISPSSSSPPSIIDSAVSLRIGARIAKGFRSRPEKRRRRAQSGERLPGQQLRGRVLAFEQGVERSKEVIQPEDRIPDVRLFVVKLEERRANIVEERGAIDLFLDIVEVESFYGERERAECRKVGPHRIGIVFAEPMILRVDARLGCGGRIEVPTQIKV